MQTDAKIEVDAVARAHVEPVAWLQASRKVRNELARGIRGEASRRLKPGTLAHVILIGQSSTKPFETGGNLSGQHVDDSISEEIPVHDAIIEGGTPAHVQNDDEHVAARAGAAAWPGPLFRLVQGNIV